MQVQLVPREVFLTRGVGHHRERLASFEEALRKAEIASFNLVNVSSIFPPGCKLISRSKGLEKLRPGQVVFAVMSRNDTNEYRRLVASSVGLALPRDTSMYGYLSEHESHGQNEREAGDYAEDLAASMLATTLGVGFDPDAAWDEKKEIYRISGRIVRTQSITQSAVGMKGSIWTTTVAAAVFILDRAGGLF
ncbi:MAG TPA: arginine decarboxylase, pyruvoyl-dependent [Planctomycetota bacterium]|nr:arginine decarboxylase, pyruvoyl-dependent [Planctomycetota bacterium]